MSRFRSGTRGCAAIASLGIAALFVGAGAARADSAAIATLVGSWSGSGRITYTDGSSESIRCTAYYTGSGRDLNMAIQCRSEKNPVNIRSKLRIEGSRASGEWEERTFNASGSASGNVGNNSMRLDVAGGGFKGNMSVSFTQSSHDLIITTEGIAMKRATMSFSRK